MPNFVRSKLEAGERLSPKEVEDAIEANPQATGLFGRVMTFARSLKDQGFIKIESLRNNQTIITITLLGRRLIDPSQNITDVYTKAMVGLHANSPLRSRMLNRSRPFLNAIFVIDQVNAFFRRVGVGGGVNAHEFSTFILGMTDCDYEKAALDIINYRRRWGSKINIDYIRDKLQSNGILDITDNSLLRDYPDEVYRKFAMTGLLTQRRARDLVFYDLADYNRLKAESIIEANKGYKFIEFAEQDDYYAFLDNVSIPWLENYEIKKQIVRSKAERLGISLNSDIPINIQEAKLDDESIRRSFRKKIESSTLQDIIREMAIVSGDISGLSKYSEVSPPTRLEFLIALLFAKRFGVEGLISNAPYGEDGLPMSHAPGNRPDMVYSAENISLVLEATLIRSAAQMVNSETSSISRHLQDEQARSGQRHLMILVAPRIHRDVANYFRHESNRTGISMVPISIGKIVELISESKNFLKFVEKLDVMRDKLFREEDKEYCDNVNISVLDQKKNSDLNCDSEHQIRRKFHF